MIDENGVLCMQGFMAVSSGIIFSKMHKKDFKETQLS